MDKSNSTLHLVVEASVRASLRSDQETGDGEWLLTDPVDGTEYAVRVQPDGTLALFPASVEKGEGRALRRFRIRVEEV